VSREFERRFFLDGAVDREFRQVYGDHYELSVSYRIVGGIADATTSAAIALELRETHCQSA
jgi:hypothetical protein